MTKWYFISQSAITPATSRNVNVEKDFDNDAQFYPNAPPPSREEYEVAHDVDPPPPSGDSNKVVSNAPPSSDQQQQQVRQFTIR